MKLKVRECKELELPLAMKTVIDKINLLTGRLLHNVQNDNYDLDPKYLSQLDAITYKFYNLLGKYLADAKQYDLHGYYLYKFNGERNVLKHPQYKIKFV